MNNKIIAVLLGVGCFALTSLTLAEPSATKIEPVEARLMKQEQVQKKTQLRKTLVRKTLAKQESKQALKERTREKASVQERNPERLIKGNVENKQVKNQKKK